MHRYLDCFEVSQRKKDRLVRNNHRKKERKNNVFFFSFFCGLENDRSCPFKNVNTIEILFFDQIQKAILPLVLL